MKTSIANIAILSFTLCTIANAADDITLSHKLISATSQDNGTLLTYQLTLSNISTSGYEHIYLEPAGYEFSQSAKDSRIRLSSLPGNGILDVTWNVNSSRDKTLFESRIPLYFNIYAITNGQRVTQVAYSSEK